MSEQHPHETHCCEYPGCNVIIDCIPDFCPDHKCKHFGCWHAIEDSPEGERLSSCYDHIRNCQCIDCDAEFLARGDRLRCYACNPYEGECCDCEKMYPWGSIEMPIIGMDRCLKCPSMLQRYLRWHHLFVTCDFAQPRAGADEDTIACMDLCMRVDPNIRLKIIGMIEENHRQAEDERFWRSQGSEIVPDSDEYGSDSE
jgi:hypothetical protein